VKTVLNNGVAVRGGAFKAEPAESWRVEGGFCERLKGRDFPSSCQLSLSS